MLTYGDSGSIKVCFMVYLFALSRDPGVQDSDEKRSLMTKQKVV